MTHDYKKTLEEFRMLSREVSESQELRSQFTYKGYDLWAMYAMRVFADLKEKHRIPAYKKDVSRPQIGSYIWYGLLSLFLTNIAVLKLIFSRTKFLIYSVDKVSSSRAMNDSRIDDLYSAIHGKIRYIECFHTLLVPDFWQNYRKRKRTGIYLESFDLFCGFLTKFFPKPHHQNPLIKKYLGFVWKTKFKIWSFGLLLRLSSVKVIFTIDDVRHYNELVLAARQLHIPVYAIQHGHFTKYHVGWLKSQYSIGKQIMPNKIIVWSDFWKQELLSLGTYFSTDDIIVGGIKIAEFVTEKIKDGGKGILIPYETDAPKEEVQSYVQGFRKLGLPIYFKVRSDIDLKRQCEEYAVGEGVNVVSNYKDILEEVGAVVGTYSSFLYDMVAYEKPVILLETSLDYGEGIVRNGLADSLSLKNIVNVEAIFKTSKQSLVERKEKLYGRNPKVLANSIEEIIKQYL